MCVCVAGESKNKPDQPQHYIHSFTVLSNIEIEFGIRDQVQELEIVNHIENHRRAPYPIFERKPKQTAINILLLRSSIHQSIQSIHQLSNPQHLKAKAEKNRTTHEKTTLPPNPNPPSPDDDEDDEDDDTAAYSSEKNASGRGARI